MRSSDPDLPSACISCGSVALSRFGEIPASTLREGYWRLLGVDVSALLPATLTIGEYCCRDCHLIFFWPLVTGDEAFYAELAKRPWYYMSEKREFEIAARYIAPGDKLLEVGGGQGAFSRYVGVANYIGLEFSAAAIASAREHGVELRAEPLERHRDKNVGRYDVACAFQVLEHVADPGGFVRAMADCVRPRGRVILSVPSEDGFAGRAINDFLNLPPHHVTRWTDAALRGVAAETGLAVEALEHETVAPYHRAWFASVRLMSALGGPFGGGPHARIQLRFPRYHVWRIAALATRLLAPLFPAIAGLRPSFRSACGHTVVAVMRKSG